MPRFIRVVASLSVRRSVFRAAPGLVGFLVVKEVRGQVSFSCVVPCTEHFILFYFISYISNMLVEFYGRLGASPSRTNRKARSPTIHIATINSWSYRKLLLGESRKCWLWLRSVVWFCKATRESLCWAFGNDRHLGERRRSNIYNMWALLLIVVSGKRG